MRLGRWFLALVPVSLVLTGLAEPQTGAPQYVKKDSRADTILASLKASGLPSLEGDWWWIGPFDNPDQSSFDLSYAPEKEADLQKTYPGRDGKVSWQPFKKFKVG